MQDDLIIQDFEDKNILKVIIQKYLPFWPFFIFSIFVCFLISYIFLRYTPKTYDVKAKILIKEDQQSQGANKVLDALDVFGEKKSVDNEIEVLKSWPLMEEVVVNLKLYTIQGTRGRIKGNTLYGISAPLVFTALNPEKIGLSEEDIDIKDKKKILFNVDFNNKKFTLSNKQYHFGDTVLIENLNFIVDRNPSFNLKKIEPEYTLQLVNVHALATILEKEISFEPTSKKSSVLVGTITTSITEQGIDILNELLHVYKTEALNDKNLVTKNTLNFLNERLGVVKKELGVVESNVENFKTQNGIVNIDAESGLYLDKVKQSDEKLGGVNLQLALLNDIEAYISGKGSNPGTVPSLIGINDPILTQLLTQLYEKESEYARLTKFTGVHNDLQGQMKDQISMIKSNIQESIRNIRILFQFD